MAPERVTSPTTRVSAEMQDIAEKCLRWVTNSGGADTTFMDYGICKRDPRWFKGKNSYSEDQAKEICHQCPVEEACGKYALLHTKLNKELTDVWGGLTQKERWQLYCAKNK